MIAGIDVSSKAVDVILLGDEGRAAQWFRFPLERVPKDEYPAWTSARSARVALPTRSWWEGWGVWLVGMEDPKSDGITPAKALGMVTGAVLALLPRNLTVVPLPPHEWKLWSIGGGNPGKGNARKEDVAAWAAEQGFTPGDLNATDAYAIARAARALNESAQQPAA